MSKKVTVRFGKTSKKFETIRECVDFLAKKTKTTFSYPEKSGSFHVGSLALRIDSITSVTIDSTTFRK